MTLLESIKQKAKENQKTIVLPEAEDERIVEAAKLIQEQGLAKPILISNNEIEGLTTIQPDERYANLLFEKRKHKGMTEEQAKEISKDPVYFATLMVEANDADGLVSGACHSTSNTLRPALQIIKTAEGQSIASSYFIMIEEEKLFFFADCGFNINPNANELAEIAIQTANSVKTYNIDPKVALLSFSTKGSAKHELVDKVVEAGNILREKQVDFDFEDELQLDAAIVPKVAESKAPNSKLKGDANILIFPDLNAGNIGYKLVQRLGGATAIGPIVQGLNKPVNDLSRGCSVQDIVDVVAITAVQAQNN